MNDYDKQPDRTSIVTQVFAGEKYESFVSKLAITKASPMIT